MIELNQSANKLKEEHWKTIVQECNRAVLSGETTKNEWLKVHNINQATFYNWQKHFRNVVATDILIEHAQTNTPNELVVSVPAKEVEFVELKPTSTSPKSGSSGATLNFNHACIEIKDDISEELLSKIFKVILNVK